MKQKINELLLIAAADNQLMIVPVVKDSDGRTVAEVVAHGQGEAEISFQEELLKSARSPQLNLTVCFGRTVLYL